MAKESLRDAKIESIPQGERIIKEGIMFTMSLYSTNKTRFPFKYAVTEKGIWTKSKKSIFSKSKEVFLSFGEIDCCKETKYGKNMTYIFFPANGKKPSNRIFFDDAENVAAILKQSIRFVN